MQRLLHSFWHKALRISDESQEVKPQHDDVSELGTFLFYIIQWGTLRQCGVYQILCIDISKNS